MKFSLLILGAFLFVAFGCSKAEEPTTEGGSSATPGATTGKPGTGNGFASVQPIFQKNCAGCHNDASPKKGLALTGYANIMKGSSEGPVIVAGDPDASTLVKALHGKDGIKRMPPAGALPEADIAAIEAWIKAGAKE
ncbi:MAG: c-type cytochrome [Fimbriimonadaceae bacterium]|nr:c-type cytochrome [Fimbriimonadaceae bacterium]